MVANSEIRVWRKERSQPYLIATKAIKKGDEIVVKYGRTYNSYDL
jgi:hypothetical protein